MKTDEILKGCEHDGSFIPVSEVKRLMRRTAIEFGGWLDQKCIPDDEQYGLWATTLIKAVEQMSTEHGFGSIIIWYSW